MQICSATKSFVFSILWKMHLFDLVYVELFFINYHIYQENYGFVEFWL